MNNTHHHTNGYRTEKPKNEEDLEDPYANLSDFYKNHPAARNEGSENRKKKLWNFTNFSFFSFFQHVRQLLMAALKV